MEKIYRVERDAIFPTYHMTNLPFLLKNPHREWGFRVEKFILNENLHYFSKFFFLLSLLYERITSNFILKYLKINILTVYRKIG